jgi:hypothetical protein
MLAIPKLLPHVEMQISSNISLWIVHAASIQEYGRFLRCERIQSFRAMKETLLQESIVPMRKRKGEL